MSTHLTDYKPTNSELRKCSKGHNFAWLTLQRAIYKTCSQCGWFERVRKVEENNKS